MDRSTVTNEVIAGLICLGLGGVIFAFRSTFTRWSVGYYGRMAHTFRGSTQGLCGR